MRRSYATLDVFTAKRLQGNPLAVVTEAEGLDAAEMQAIAREFNLSETVFVLPPRDPVNTARIRIFTPVRELPFAGHPTVGTIVLLAQLRAPELLGRQHLSLVIEEEVGPVQCTARKVNGVALGSFDLPRLPQPCEAPEDQEAIALALGLEPADIGFAAHRPSGFSAGNPFSFVPLRGLDAARRAKPNPAHWAAAFGRIPGAFVYTGETERPDSSYHARMFAPTMGMAEDPATGSAVAAFAGVLMRHESPADGDHTVIVEQGLEMGRPSFITLGMDVTDGALTAASIGGAAVIVSQGSLEL